MRTIALLLLFSLPAILAAQPVREVQRIHISEEGTTCQYVIENQTNQQTFLLPPRGVVVFRTIGPTRSRIVAYDDEQVPATLGPNTARLNSQRAAVSLVGRDALGRSTEHEIEITCCVEEAEDGSCSTWKRARPIPTHDQGALPLPTTQTPPDSDQGGPSASDDPTQEPIVVDGPVMKIVDG